MSPFLVRFRSVFLLSLFLFSVLAVSLSPMLSQITNATSVFDQTYRKVENLDIKFNYPGYLECPVQNVKNTWTDYVTTEAFWRPGYWDPTAAAAFNTAVSSGQYGVSWLDGGGDTRARVYWSVSSNAYVDFGDISGVRTAQFHGGSTIIYSGDIIVKALYSGRSCDLEFRPATSTPSYAPVSDAVASPSAWWNFFVTAPVTYPLGYEGQQVYNGITLADIYPKFGYNVGPDNILNALIYERENIEAKCSNYGIKWTVLDTNNVVLDEKYQKEADVYTYKFNGYDTYTLKTEYTNGIPCKPLTSNYIASQVSILINGEVSIGSTAINVCSIVNGVFNCTPADPYTDCSTFGTNVGGYFECVMGNFGTYLRSSLISLFVPRSSFMTGFTTKIQTDLNTNLGGVYQSISFFQNFIGTIVTQSAVGTCMLDPPGTFFGSEVSFNLCIFQDQFSEVWVVMQSLAVGGTSLILVFALVRKYQEVVDKR